ncbi:hypothetical protein RJ640_023686 [Escallonia rubra]|uniref:Reverse transcriptase Ty1/copia-type domain-containing protein n=1 Tax=Escallonia rubra TaxID=112253 RepID=A0AA88RHK8_9ASTE|nr:hypothetical protein RJ640_023686 [Escallonia rubra]
MNINEKKDDTDKNQGDQGRGCGRGRSRDEPKEENVKNHYAEENKVGDDTVLLAREGSKEQKKSSWYLDTGSNNHMCGYKHMFIKMDESVTRNINFRDMSKILVKERVESNTTRGSEWIQANQQSKGYKLYNLVDKKIKVSEDMTFDAKCLWDWSDRDKEQYVFHPIDTNKKEVEEEPLKPVTPSSPAFPTQSGPTSSSSNSNCVKMFDDFKKKMANEFEMSDIGLMSYYLGIEVKQRDDGIFISQEAYAKEVLKKFKLQHSQYSHRDGKEVAETHQRRSNRYNIVQKLSWKFEVLDVH